MSGADVGTARPAIPAYELGCPICEMRSGPDALLMPVDAFAFGVAIGETVVYSEPAEPDKTLMNHICDAHRATYRASLVKVLATFVRMASRRKGQGRS